MITSLPNLNTLLTPVLTWALAGISVIAAIILVWNIYETWTQNPDRFSWFAAIAWNAQAIINTFITGGTPPAP